LNPNSLIKSFFYGNYFYGLCAVALSIEAILQQMFPLNHVLYFFAVFCVTVVYYSRAYITEVPVHRGNQRSAWYSRNKRFVFFSQAILTLLVFSLLVIFIKDNWQSIFQMSLLQLALIAVFPLTGIFYYGVSGTKYTLRKIGWLKPFVIGFAWAGLVTVYPIIYYTVANNIPFELTVIGALLFLKNFMFVSVLCIMFDIKDYVSDSNQNLNTFVVKQGLKKTIYFIIIPLCLIGLGTFILYGITRGFHPIKIALNVVPFVLLLLTAYSLQTRRSLLYYLFVVDGLMLVKAICGSIAVVYF